MRKLLFATLICLLTLLCVCATAETYVFDDLFAAVDIPDGYIVLTPDNLSTNATWLESRGTTQEAAANDFLKRGVLIQCWSQEYDLCFELTAVATEQAQAVFDLNEQTTSFRADYRLGHYPDNIYENDGYEFSSADWKNTSNGRFLVLKYLKRDGAEIVHRGLMRRTIRNGYEITFDLQTFTRKPSNKDNSLLNTIWNSFKFVEILPLPPIASAKVNITKVPPTETNEREFTIEGTAAEGVKLISSTMGLSYPDAIISEVVVGANGKFKLPIRLPKEGAFLTTVTGEYQGEDVIELAYPVTYQHTLLAVNITSPMPTTVTTSEVVLSGTAEPGASIQVFVNTEAVANKKVTAAGKFKIEIETKKEGPYEVVLAFSKKNLSDRRITYSFTRQWSENDMLKEIKSQAIKPGYSTLKNKIKGYEGRIMGYKCYLVSVNQSGDEWIAQMALTKRGSEYTSIILVTCNELPTTTIGGQVMMYGTCVGMSLPDEGDESQASYPCFELLTFASIE